MHRYRPRERHRHHRCQISNEGLRPVELSWVTCGRVPRRVEPTCSRVPARGEANPVHPPWPGTVPPRWRFLKQPPLGATITVLHEGNFPLFRPRWTTSTRTPPMGKCRRFGRRCDGAHRCDDCPARWLTHADASDIRATAQGQGGGNPTASGGIVWDIDLAQRGHTQVSRTIQKPWPTTRICWNRATAMRMQRRTRGNTSPIFTHR